MRMSWAAGRGGRQDQAARAEGTGRSLDWPLPKLPGVQGTDFSGLAKFRQVSP